MPNSATTPPWAEAMLDLLSATDQWITASVKRNSDCPWHGGHDEGTFTSSWFPYYQLTGDQRVLDFLHFMRDGFIEFANQEFHHGYYSQGEAHHQPEPFIFFMTRLFHIDPSNQAVISVIEDAAEHVGNWVDGIPAWYDWDNHRFRSWKIGSRKAEECPPWDHEVPDHVRFVQMVVTAYLATKKDRYLDLARDYLTKWARLILDSETVPGYLVSSGDLSSIPDNLQDKERMSEIENVELHVSAGTSDTLLDLYEITDDSLYADAARELLCKAMCGLADPYCQPVAAQILKYREATGDRGLDEPVVQIVSSMNEELNPQSTLLLIDDRVEPHPMGLGRRKDGVKWGYRTQDDRLVEEAGPSPPTLMLAYRITGCQRYLAAALHKAARRLRLACRVLPDGRHHGCAGATIGAVASGHGRGCGIGDVTGTLPTAAFGAYRFANGEKLRVRYGKPDGSPGLPEGVVPLVRPKGEVLLFNSTDSQVEARVLSDATEATHISIPAGSQVGVET